MENCRYPVQKKMTALHQFPNVSVAQIQVLVCHLAKYKVNDGCGWGSGTNVTFLMPVTCCLGEFILFFELIVLPLPTLLLSQWPFSGFQVSHGQYRWSASPQPHVIVALNRVLSSFCLLCSHCQQPAQTWRLSLFLAVSLSRCITLLWGAYGLRLPAFGASCRILQVLSAQPRFSVLPGEMSACDLHTY